MGELVIIGEKLNKDLKRLVSIIMLNDGCIDEIRIQGVIFLLKEKIGFKYRFNWNGFIPYSRELTNQLRILVRLGLLYKDNDKFCVPSWVANLQIKEEEFNVQVRELLELTHEELIKKVKEIFFSQ